MFKHLILISITFLCFSSVTATYKSKGFKMETQFNYSNNEVKVASKSSIILDENNKTWNTLTEPKKGVALLGRIVKSDKTTLQLEYIIVNTTKNNAVVSTPAIIAILGEKAEINVGTNHETVVISLLATPTEYSAIK